MVSQDEFRQAVSKFPTGVTVVTTIDDQGRPHAMTANSFTSVCLEPPVVLICVAHGTHTFNFLERTGRFGINILKEDQEALGAYFSKKPEDRHGHMKYAYTMSEEGIPALDGSMVFFGCVVMTGHVVGDHTIYLAEVKVIHQSEAGAPLLFFKSHWYHPASSGNHR